MILYCSYRTKRKEYMIADEVINNFYKALEEMENPDGAFLHTDLEDPSFVIKLQYSRHDFIEDIKRATASLKPSERTNITSFFGFVLEESDGFTTLRGYPSIENLNKEDIVSYAKVYHYVKNFVSENQITIKNHPVTSKCLNAIVTAFPEFLTLEGKIQHHTHSYSVDIHTLKVLQGVMQNSTYASLPKDDKRALQMAVLMHDITKKEGEIDKSHPVCSAKDASFIFNKIDMPIEEKKKICLIIRNHDWLERYNKGITSAQEFAQTLKDGNNFKMLCILAEADLKAVQRGGAFFEKYGSVLHDGCREIGSLIGKVFSAA